MHTPGPWYLDLRIGCLAIYPATEIGQHECLSGPMDWAIHRAYGKRNNFRTWTMNDTVVANARLIASSPELLGALLLTAERYEENGFEETAYRVVLAAIQKATEGSNE